MRDYSEFIEDYIKKIVTTLSCLDINEISSVIDVLESCLYREGSVYVFGNGGSASTASHMQNDFNKGVSEGLSTKFRFVCLSDNIATITAIANDWSYDDVYYRQLNGRLTSKDLVIAISCQGNSKNVIKAVEYAKLLGCPVIGVTGYQGGILKQLSNYHLHANIDDMQVCEDVHLIFNHMIMSILLKKQCM